MRARRWLVTWTFAVAGLGRFVARQHTTEAAVAGAAPLSVAPLASIALDDGGEDEVLWEASAPSTAAFATTLPDQDEPENTSSSLLEWAAQYRQKNRHRPSGTPSPQAQTCALTDDCFLVVSVKTRVVDGFHNRQVIRSTWADPHITRPLHTRVVFLACEPDPSKVADMNATLDALALEKQVYGDLLTHELGGCVDSYFKLVDKIVGFFHWVGTHHATAAYVMMADDDVYTRLDRIVAMLRDEATPRTRYYAGQVSYVQLGRFIETIRDKSRKNYVSEHDYPFSVHVPRAIGAHYLLSMDLVQFIAQNQQDLRGAGAIEDLSVGLWLRALLQVHPVHLRDFDSITARICRNSLFSYSDISLPAIRQMHKNVVHGDPLCRGFGFHSWSCCGVTRKADEVYVPVPDFEYDWHFQIDAHSRAMQIDITVHVTSAGIRLPPISYVPSVVSPFYFCDRFYERLSRDGQTLPALQCDDLLIRLGQFLQDTPPTNTALFALTESNLPPVEAQSADMVVWLSHSVLRWRAFFESVMGMMHPEQQVFVIDDMSYGKPTKIGTSAFVVVNASALKLLPDLPSTHRVFVVETEPVPSTHPIAHHRGAISFTHARGQVDHQTPQLYVPLASLVFSDSLVHSPIALLDFSSKRKPEFSPIQPFAMPQCNPRVAELLETIQAVPTQELECTPEHGIGTQDYDQEQALGLSTPATLFAFDTDVVRYTQAKFVLAFERHQRTSPGYIGSSIVAAFVAGSVPIYDGDDAMVSRLFNPKAFISCGRFASLRECGEFVVEVDRSAVLYAAMRNEPPVMNATAFYEVFSWHPDVRQRLQNDKRRDRVNLDMVERLRNMINDI